MYDLLVLLICITAGLWMGRSHTTSAPVVLPWGSARRGNTVTLALWDRTSPAMRADGALLAAARLLTPAERSAVKAGVSTWNERLARAGVPLRVEIVPTQNAQIVVYGADTLTDERDREVEGQTSLWIRDSNTSQAQIERATISISRPQAFPAELGRALGIMAHNNTGTVQRAEDVKLLQAAYESQN